MDNWTFIKELDTLSILDYGTYNVGREKHRKTYVDMPLSYDIETTSVELITHRGETEEVAFPYVGMIGWDSKVYYFRYMDDFVKKMDFLNLVLETYDIYVICLIHFAPYEFAFTSGHMDFSEIFAVEKNKPIKFNYGRIEFRDSFILSGYSLGKLAENYTTTQKLKGDLDYDKIRFPETELTDKEIEYCKNDVIILNEYWETIRERFLQGNNKKIPLTKTGIVRDDIRLNIPHNKKKSYYNYIKAVSPDYDLYKILEKMFAGGYTHANYYHVGRLLSNVDSYDYKSSYPGVMFEYAYPINKFVPIDTADVGKLDIDKHAYILDIVLLNVRSKTPHHTISFSKILNRPKEYELDNGRLIQADEIHLIINEMDWSVIRQFYKFSAVGVIRAWRADKAKLPRFLLEKVIKYFNQKETLSGVKGKETEYLNYKEMVNAIYGMMVTKQDYGKIKFKNNKWIEDQGSYNTDKQFLLYQWGVWITSYARYNLLSMVKRIGNDVVYCDTDSIKLLHSWKYKKMFEKDNERISRLIKNTCKERNLEYQLISKLGLWEHEDDAPYHKFITWGAKRYMKDGKVTLSGFPKTIMDKEKEEMVDHMEWLCARKKTTPEELFRPPFKLTEEESGKNVLKYHYSNEKTKVYYEIDGEEKSMLLQNWIYSCKSTFKMSLAKDFDDLIEYSKYFINTSGGLEDGRFW